MLSLADRIRWVELQVQRCVNVPIVIRPRSCYYILTIVAAGLTANGKVVKIQVRKSVFRDEKQQQLHHYDSKNAIAVGVVGFSSTTATTL